MTEDDLLKAVIDMCRLFGVMVAHFRPAQVRDKDGKTRWVTAVQGDGKGYPDLTMTGPGGVLFRELKSKAGTASPEQAVWLGALKSAGADAGIWRPADLRSGRIERELRNIGNRNSARKSPAIRQDVPATRHEPPAWLRTDLRRRA